MKKAAVIYWSGTGNTEAMANAVLEGADSVVRNVKRRARGFRDMDYFATMVYLTCGKLDLKAVTTSPSVRVFCKLARTRTSSQLV